MSGIGSVCDSYSQLYLAFIEIFCLYDVIDDIIRGEGWVQNCTASHWSALFTLTGQNVHCVLDDLTRPLKLADI